MNQFNLDFYPGDTGSNMTSSVCYFGNPTPQQEDAYDDETLATKKKVFEDIIHKTLKERSAEELFGLFDDNEPQQVSSEKSEIIDRLDKIIELLQHISTKDIK